MAVAAAIRYAFIHTYKPVLDDAPFRAFDTMQDYRRWCEEKLADWLGYGRSQEPPCLCILSPPFACLLRALKGPWKAGRGPGSPKFPRPVRYITSISFFALILQREVSSVVIRGAVCFHKRSGPALTSGIKAMVENHYALPVGAARPHLGHFCCVRRSCLGVLVVGIRYWYIRSFSNAHHFFSNVHRLLHVAGLVAFIKGSDPNCQEMRHSCRPSSPCTAFLWRDGITHDSFCLEPHPYCLQCAEK